MIPVGILGSARWGSAGLVFVSSAVAAGVTVTLPIAAPDSTHLLVLVVTVDYDLTPTPPGGWTEATGGGVSGGTGTYAQVRIYARQGNGSINSVTLSDTAGTEVIGLMAFSGYTSATAIESGGAGSSSVNSVSISPTTQSFPYVSIVAARLSASSAGWSLTNGYTQLSSASTVWHLAYKVCAASVSSSTTVSWTSTSVQNRRMYALFA